MFIHASLDQKCNSEYIKTTGEVEILKNSSTQAPVQDHQVDNVRPLGYVFLLVSKDLNLWLVTLSSGVKRH